MEHVGVVGMSVDVDLISGPERERGACSGEVPGFIFPCEKGPLGLRGDLSVKMRPADGPDETAECPPGDGVNSKLELTQL